MLDDGFCGIEGNRGRGAAKVKLGESSLEAYQRAVSFSRVAAERNK
jgi:hypothetical protein